MKSKVKKKKMKKDKNKILYYLPSILKTKCSVMMVFSMPGLNIKEKKSIMMLSKVIPSGTYSVYDFLIFYNKDL